MQAGGGETLKEGLKNAWLAHQAILRGVLDRPCRGLRSAEFGGCRAPRVGVPWLMSGMGAPPGSQMLLQSCNKWMGGPAICDEWHSSLKDTPEHYGPRHTGGMSRADRTIRRLRDDLTKT